VDDDRCRVSNPLAGVQEREAVSGVQAMQCWVDESEPRKADDDLGGSRAKVSDG